MRPNKYGAVNSTVDGIVFDSKREARRWQELKLLERAGKITNLERQVTYVLAPGVKIEGEKRARPPLRFTADFRYVEDGELVVEDSKGFADKAFRIRQHLMKFMFNIDVRIT